MTTFISQRFSSDCAVACMAMFLGVDYEEVARHCTGWELTRGGMPNHRETYITSLFEVEIVFRDISKIDRRQPAVLTVPSLNSDTGGTHAVYWDGARLHDPNHGRPGKRYYGQKKAWDAAIEGYQRAEQQETNA